MSSLSFDTLRYAETLEHAGIAPEQAKASAEALRIALGDMVELQNLATKHDLAVLEGKFATEIANAKADIVKWVAGLLVAQAGLIAALVKLL